jgi:2-methylcitrate dehydratase PrpD
MTLTGDLATRALAPTAVSDKERLRSLTLTNVAAGLGKLGRATLLLQELPLGGGRAGDTAFLNAMRLHARTQDDFHPTGRVHVGAVTLATTLALADRAGTRLLECLAAGYETMCAVASAYSLDAQARGYRPTGVFGPIGAAASAAVAIGLDHDGIANAIGLAAARSGGTMQSWVSGTDEWLLEVGAAARAGLEAALFTEAGAVASKEAFEGTAGWTRAYFGDPEPTRLTAAVTRPSSYIGEVALKPYPVSGIAQVPTELSCRAHGDLNGHTVGSAVVRLSKAEYAYPGSANKGPFRSQSDALMSVGFCVACGLTDGNVRLERLEHPNDLGELTASVGIESDSTLGESEAVLKLEFDDGPREYHGAGTSLLYPPWESLARETRAVATRSEADLALVERAADHLRAEHPDARDVNAVLTAALGGAR